MDLTQILTESPADAATRTGGRCPDCGSAAGTPGPIVATIFPGRPLRRCARCETCHTVEGPVECLRHCQDCGMPFLAPGEAETGSPRCEACRDHDTAATMRDHDVARATEREVRAGLRSEWRFLGAPVLSAYLDRLTRHLESRIGADLPAVRVEVFDDERWWTLGLPSGTILVSLGTLKGLDDEAELVFVLAHEMIHAAAPAAAAHLSRIGLAAVAVDDDASSTIAWSRAAHDIVRLGYGLEREREADESAFRVVAESGYDLAAVRRYLGRLDAMVAAGDTRVADLALAHPLPATRLRRLESFAGHLATSRAVPRTNREVFRRAAGRHVLDSGLESVEGLGNPLPAPSSSEPGPQRAGLRWALLAAAAVAVVGLAVWYLLQA